MGIETPADYGGAESSFTAAIIAIEELAKVDPSVSVLCDVHNTLVNTIFRTHGTKDQQERFLPLLSESKVRYTCFLVVYVQLNESLGHLHVILAGFLLLVRARFWLRRVRPQDSC